MEQKKSHLVKIKKYIVKYLFLTLGAFIAGFAIEAFLVPNGIIDGGVIGVSMILSHVTKFNLGLLIGILNLPFIFLAYKKMGKKFLISTFYSIVILSLSVNIWHSVAATESFLLATVFGGVILGCGVGLILRNDAALDGTEILSIAIAKKMSLSVGEFIMFLNLFIYSCAGFVYGWDNAMYSILTYFVAYKVIDIVMEGLNSSKSIRIFSKNYKQIGEQIMKELDVSVTYMKSLGGYSGEEQIFIYCVVSRLEMAKLRELVKNIDDTAFIVIQDVHEVEGVRIKKK